MRFGPPIVLHALRRRPGSRSATGPTPGPREVLVQITAVGVCGSDVHYYEHGRIGPYIVEAPLILGDESAGHVVELGEGRDQARRRRPRDARAGRAVRGAAASAGPAATTSASTYVFFATPPIDGAFAEFVPIHEDYAFGLPDSLSDEEGRADGAALGRHLGVPEGVGARAGDRVLVTGAGPIGILAASVRAGLRRHRGHRLRRQRAAARGRLAAPARRGRWTPQERLSTSRSTR